MAYQARVLDGFERPQGRRPTLSPRTAFLRMCPVDPELLKILACPETHQPLAEADAALLKKVNESITGGSCKNVGGEAVADALTAGLVREDGKIVYPVRDEIPVLLVDEGIPA